MRTRFRTGIALAAIATTLSLTACGGDADVTKPAPADAREHTDDISNGVAVDRAAADLVPPDVRKSGKLVVAMDLSSPPTTFMASDNTTPIGFNPDIARLIAKKLGLQLDIKNVKFDTIIPGLDGGRYNLTVSGMSANEDRLKVLDMVFYFKNGSSIAVAHGNPKNLTNETLCGMSIAVQSGSVQELKRLPTLSEKTCESKGKPAIKPVSLPSVQDALTQVASRRVDGVFYDTTSLNWADAQQPNTFQVLKPQVATADNAVALGKGSALTPAVQAAIQSIMDSPKYTEALHRWGFDSLGIDKASIATPQG
ncbi:ABC transporter substrate-binding protein [Terrabacter sp. GCM10028922]|uniref:ABC transporter substrate-binding protein n=1 Tax=Terrabacter sp. GCM10028922 TaxID=3273428 RepID=UPI00361C4AA5